MLHTKWDNSTITPLLARTEKPRLVGGCPPGRCLLDADKNRAWAVNAHVPTSYGDSEGERRQFKAGIGFVRLAVAKVDQSTRNSGGGRLLSCLKRMKYVTKRLLVENTKAALSRFIHVKLEVFFQRIKWS